jgi:hypothetical protein
VALFLFKDKGAVSLPHFLTYIYINDIIQKWKRNISPGIKLSREIRLNVLLYADDVVIIQKKLICPATIGTPLKPDM